MTHKIDSPSVAGTATTARVINIAVDTRYVYSHISYRYDGTGIYMMDNNVAGGSTGQGGLQLSSRVSPGAVIAFNVFPINYAGRTGDSVRIVDIEVAGGTNVFGGSGYPVRQPSDSYTYQWLGRTDKEGYCTCQVKIGVSVGGAPMQYYEWNCFLNCSA